jgi:hypothetical protein
MKPIASLIQIRAAVNSTVETKAQRDPHNLFFSLHIILYDRGEVCDKHEKDGKIIIVCCGES